MTAPTPARLIGTAILAGAALLLEIALTRLFSTLYFPPYVFFIISSAIFGHWLRRGSAGATPSISCARTAAAF